MNERFIYVEDNGSDTIYDLKNNIILYRNTIAEKMNDIVMENEQLKSFVEYEKREHKHWKRECLESIKEIAQLKREIIQLKGNDGND